MSAEKPKGKDEKITAWGGFERMFEMMSQCCKSAESLPDCPSVMSMMEKFCRPQTENRGEGGHG